MHSGVRVQDPKEGRDGAVGSVVGQRANMRVGIGAGLEDSHN